MLEVRAAATLVGMRGVAAVVDGVGGEAGAARDAPSASIVALGYLVEATFGEFAGTILAGGWLGKFPYNELSHGATPPWLGPLGVGLAAAPQGPFYIV